MCLFYLLEMRFNCWGEWSVSWSSFGLRCFSPRLALLAFLIASKIEGWREKEDWVWIIFMWGWPTTILEWTAVDSERNPYRMHMYRVQNVCATLLFNFISSSQQTPHTDRALVQYTCNLFEGHSCLLYMFLRVLQTQLSMLSNRQKLAGFYILKRSRGRQTLTSASVTQNRGCRPHLHRNQ